MHSFGNIFNPLSTPADETFRLSLLMLAICAAIFVTVAALLTYSIVRFRRRPGQPDREPPQVYGSNQIEIAWTVLPILIVFVLTMATVRVIFAIQGKAPAGALPVTVVGHQWWWEFRYPSLGIVTANELHVPVSGQNSPGISFLRLESADVAHSFWIPQLAGKTDVIPNRVNYMWIQPTVTGIFLGNCAEFCGTQHAGMLLRAVVQTPAEFADWASSQKQNAQVAATGSALFLSLACVDCHTIRGTSAAGTFGPDLTHLASRQTLAAGVMPNTPKNLRSWLQDPDSWKPGSLMPNMQLTGPQLDQLTAYLEQLK